MEATEKIKHAQTDPAAQERFIRENLSFIHGCAAQGAGHYVDESDEVFSEALVAFHDALLHYDESKGHFHAFAKVCILNRIKDYYRKQNRHRQVIPFESLGTTDDHGAEKPFEPVAENTGMSETALEIASLKIELEAFDISFFDLPKAAPKAKKHAVPVSKLCTAW